MLLTFYLEQWQWQGRASWELALSAVDYGAVLYAMLAVLVEKGGSLMFWAWEKHKERMAKMEKRLREEGREEVLAEILSAARAEEKQTVESVVQRVAQAQGIALDEMTQR